MYSRLPTSVLITNFPSSFHSTSLLHITDDWWKISVMSVVTSHLSFLILLTWVFSLLLFMTRLLRLDPLSWDVDCLLTLCPFLIPCSLGNRGCTFAFLIFIIVKRKFLYKSLYILTERSLKHLGSISAWIPVSFFLSLSLSPSLQLSHFLIFDSGPPGSSPLKDRNTN